VVIENKMERTKLVVISGERNMNDCMVFKGFYSCMQCAASA